MDRFIAVTDELSKTINEKAGELLEKLKEVPIDNIGIPDRCLDYFKGSHFKRLFFSIETSANLLNQCIRLTGKPVTEIVLMDYGAGVGTLYTLAKMIGCKKVIYNDFLKDWQLSAQLIGKAINVEVDTYLLGDIEDTLKSLQEGNISCDIITSRNVIEHIYRLDNFYSQIAKMQPGAIVFCSTTANRRNPLTRIQHYRMHQKWEKHYIQSRKTIIKNMGLSFSDDTIDKLAVATKGLNKTDIEKAVNQYNVNHTVPDPAVHGSNTCEPYTGVWVEHLIAFKEYRQLISEKNFKVIFKPGFWDTHYTAPWKNLIGLIINPVIKQNHSVGLIFAPFVYVIAIPLNKNKTLTKL